MSSALAIITVDSPKLILASDPLFALLDFFTSAFPAVETPPEEAMTILPQEEETTETVSPAVAANSLSFRIEIVKPTILILESDSDSQTQAIQLTLDQLLVAHQGILALNIQKIGMSLLRMDQPKETVRFLDDIDLTLSIDSRQVATHQMTDIELQVQPIIFRASYRDIMLITDIVNKAIALASRPSPDADSNAAEADKFGSAVVDGNSSANATSMALSSRRRSSRGSIGASPAAKTSRRRSTVSRGHRPAKPKVILSKEHVRWVVFVSSCLAACSSLT
jgi:vacuolar protein sorting-associated protein 13A/C